MAHPIGLAALSVLELSPADMVTCAANAGYTHVGLRLIPATTTEVRWPTVGMTPMMKDVERRLAGTGVRVLDIEIFRLEPHTQVRDFLPALETGAALGATDVLVAGNDPDESRLVERFAQLCDLGAPLGLSMNLEPMPWTDVKSFRDGVRLLASAARVNGGVLIDAIHFDRAGGRASEIGDAPGTLLRYLQICDAPAQRPTDTATLLHQARAARLMPGDGGLDLPGILRAVPRDIPISLEIPMAELARTVPAEERARRMLAKMRALLESAVPGDTLATRPAR